MYSVKQPLLIVIGGPTGIGKTALAIKLAKYLGTEIISADSRQVYKELRIGTAVPTPEELNAVKHHFIQIRSVDESYNASMYEFEVLGCLELLFKRYNVVIMVGGSGLYINAVLYGIDDLPTIPAHIRKHFKMVFESEGLEGIQQRVNALDPDYFEKVDVNNPKRLLKALEVHEVTGKPYSTFLKNQTKNRPFRTLMINLDMNREELYARINQRVDAMVDEGLLEEARNMVNKQHLTPLKTVGYKELFEYFREEVSLEEAVTQIKNHTRAYARKQLTWFRRYEKALWFSPHQVKEMIKAIEPEF